VPNLIDPRGEPTPRDRFATNHSLLRIVACPPQSRRPAILPRKDPQKEAPQGSCGAFRTDVSAISWLAGAERPECQGGRLPCWRPAALRARAASSAAVPRPQGARAAVPAEVSFEERER